MSAGGQVSADEALRQIKEARDQKQRILGVDSFHMEGSMVKPALDHILDLSDVGGTESWCEAEAFVQERSDSGLRFEVVVE